MFHKDRFLYFIYRICIRFLIINIFGFNAKEIMWEL